MVVTKLPAVVAKLPATDFDGGRSRVGGKVKEIEKFYDFWVEEDVGDVFR